MRPNLPDRRLPVAYLLLAHCSLLAAFLVVAIDPRSVAGFYYHPRMLAVVHMVTLGWITSSILGVLYVIAPLVLRAPMPVTRRDWWAFGLFAVGVLGMVSHFWLDATSGMLWAAAMVIASFEIVVAGFLPALRASSIPAEHKLHFRLAFLNLFLAAGLGFLAGLDKLFNLVSSEALANAFAHAHLAALGWATLMVMGAGYRLLPMLLPAAMPRGRRVAAGAILMEVGVLGLTLSILTGWPLRLLFGALCLAAIGIFLDRVGWMLRNRRRAPAALKRPDVGVAQVALALTSLILAAWLGLALALGPAAEWKLRAGMAYGVLALVGFLSQMVVGVSARLLPIYAWFRAEPERRYEGVVPSPHELPARGLQFAVASLWLVGVPLLVWGLTFDAIALLCIGAWLLAAAAVLGLVQLFALQRAAGEDRERPAESLPERART